MQRNNTTQNQNRPQNQLRCRVYPHEYGDFVVEEGEGGDRPTLLRNFPINPNHMIQSPTTDNYVGDVIRSLKIIPEFLRISISILNMSNHPNYKYWLHDEAEIV